MTEENSAIVADAQLLSQLAEFNDEQNELESHIQAYANKKLAPLFEKRRQALRQVPGFWTRSIVNSTLLDEYLGADDLAVFEHLKDVHVTYDEDNPKSFNIHLEFEDNEHLKTLVIDKKFDHVPAKDDETPEKYVSKAVELEWKEGKDPKSTDEDSIFQWFAYEGEGPAEFHGATDLALTIADDLFPHALRYFTEEADLDDIDAEFDLSDEEEDDEEDNKRENEDGEEPNAKKSKTN